MSRRLQDHDFDTENGPCYVITCNGFRLAVAYKDDWCYGPSRHLGTADDDEAARQIIKADIRQHWTERNGLPVWTISDHGNACRIRTIRLRRREAAR